MGRVLNVTEDDWDYFAKVVCSVNAGTRKRRGETATVALARAVRQELEAQAARGRGRPGRILTAGTDRGFQDAVKAVLKQQVGTIAVGYNGSAQIVSLPTVYAVRRSDPETGELLKQSELWQWFVLTWDDFERLVVNLLAQGRVLTERAEALRSILPLRELYPESRTPLEAMEQAGMDPNAFTWEEEQAQ